MELAKRTRRDAKHIRKLYLSFLKKQKNPVSMRKISQETGLDYITVMKYTHILKSENKIKTTKLNKTLTLVELCKQ